MKAKNKLVIRDEFFLKNGSGFRSLNFLEVRTYKRLNKNAFNIFFVRRQLEFFWKMHTDSDKNGDLNFNLEIFRILFHDTDNEVFKVEYVWIYFFFVEGILN